jgi:hypothetical protein
MKEKNDYQKFEKLTHELLKIPHDEIKKQLEVEKKRKKI